MMLLNVSSSLGFFALIAKCHYIGAASAYNALNNTSIRDAVDAWLVDPNIAEAKYGHIRTWNTSQVTDMLMLFDHNIRPSEDFNEDLTGWDTSKVTSMAWLFNGAYSFNGDVATWDTSRVTWMKATFQAASAFNRNVSSWNTSSVIIMSEMFNGAFSFNCDLTTWDTSHVEELFSMFASASSFNGDVSTWDTSRIPSMESMFAYASSFNHVLCWNTSLAGDAGTFNTFTGSQGSFSKYPFPGCRTSVPTALPTVSPRPTISIKPTSFPTNEQTLRPTVVSTMKPTFDSSRPAEARYIKITRTEAFSEGAAVGILGIDVYDSDGHFVSDESTPSMSSVYRGDPDRFGPQILIDGLHRQYTSSGDERLTQTNGSIGEYVQLDFGRDILISTVVLWNPRNPSSSIVGCTLSVINNERVTTYSEKLMDEAMSVYEWEFGPRPRILLRTTNGPIRSLFGRCIDSHGASNVSGSQLQIYDCNGSPSQQWARPTSLSTDMRLQTMNDLCMDAAGNGAVVLSSCNSTLHSQKWIYDGRNIRLKYNTGLCLTIRGGKSLNRAKLIVSSCDNGLASA